MKIKRHVSNRVLVLLMAILSIFPLMAQQIEVAGTVSDKDGEPLIGASVLVVGAKLGAATDIDGNFSITAPANRNCKFLTLAMNPKP